MSVPETSSPQSTPKKMFKAQRKIVKSNDESEKQPITSKQEEKKLDDPKPTPQPKTEHSLDLYMNPSWLILDGKKLMDSIAVTQSKTTHEIINCLRNLGVCYAAYNFVKRSVMAQTQTLFYPELYQDIDVSTQTKKEMECKSNDTHTEKELLSMARELKRYYVGFSWGVNIFQEFLDQHSSNKVEAEKFQDMLLVWSQLFIVRQNNLWFYPEITFMEDKMKKMPLLKNNCINEDEAQIWKLKYNILIMLLNLTENMDQPGLCGVRTRLYELTEILNRLPLAIDVIINIQDQVQFILESWSKKTKDNTLEVSFSDYVKHFRKWCEKNPTMCKFITKEEIVQMHEKMQNESSKKDVTTVKTGKTEPFDMKTLQKMIDLSEAFKKREKVKGRGRRVQK